MRNDLSLVRDERTGESYYYCKHRSGLSVYVMEMPGFSSVNAQFGTKYGSINTTFKTKNDDDFVTVPEGIAHFLEHKLFENEECDVFELYAKTGANGNAYTTFGRTVYLYECTDNYLSSLEILLNSVRSPYFTRETIDKEQGIIGEEIKMCMDSPYRAVFFELLKAVYKEHPVSIEIAGTCESIAKIDASLLYRCYNTFYNLNNMALCVAGNCKAEEVLEVCDRLLTPDEDLSLETVMPEEPREVVSDTAVTRMEVGIPLFSIGFKAKPCMGAEMIKKEYASGFLIDMIFGPTSEFYKKNLEFGLINSTFGTETVDGEGYFLNILSGESREPEKLREAVYEEIERVKREGLDRSEFSDLKKTRYASLIRSFSNVGSCASMMMGAHMTSSKPFDPIEILSAITFEDVISYMDELLNRHHSAMSVVLPL